MKKSGSVVFFMELMVVIMFFAVSTVVILRLFMIGYLNERKSSALSEAMIEMQNTIEGFRAEGFDALLANGWSEMEDTAAERRFTKNEEDSRISYRITLTTESRAGGERDFGEISAYITNDAEGGPICSMKMSRYSMNDGGAAE